MKIIINNVRREKLIYEYKDLYSYSINSDYITKANKIIKEENIKLNNINDGWCLIIEPGVLLIYDAINNNFKINSLDTRISDLVLKYIVKDEEIMILPQNNKY